MLGALLSSPAPHVRLITALQVLQVLEVDILWPRWVARIGEILAARDWRALALTNTSPSHSRLARTSTTKGTAIKKEFYNKTNKERILRGKREFVFANR